MYRIQLVREIIDPVVWRSTLLFTDASWILCQEGSCRCSQLTPQTSQDHHCLEVNLLFRTITTVAKTTVDIKDIENGCEKAWIETLKKLFVVEDGTLTCFPVTTNDWFWIDGTQHFWLLHTGTKIIFSISRHLNPEMTAVSDASLERHGWDLCKPLEEWKPFERYSNAERLKNNSQAEHLVFFAQWTMINVMSFDRGTRTLTGLYNLDNLHGFTVCYITEQLQHIHCICDTQHCCQYRKQNSLKTSGESAKLIILSTFHYYGLQVDGSLVSCCVIVLLSLSFSALIFHQFPRGKYFKESVFHTMPWHLRS